MKYLLLTATLFIAILLKAQTANTGEFIAVMGEAKGNYMPDILNFNFSVNVTEKKQDDAVKKLTSQVNLFIDKIKSLGIDPKKIQLEGYNLEESLDYSGDKIKKLGYEASESLELKLTYTDNDFGRIVDSISSTRFPNISFTYQMEFSDSLQQKIKNELIVKASDNAHQIAQTLAKSRNVTLGDVFSIEYTENISALYGLKFIPPPPPAPLAYDKMDVAPKISSSISMKGIENTQQVRIVYHIKTAR